MMGTAAIDRAGIVSDPTHASMQSSRCGAFLQAPTGGCYAVWSVLIIHIGIVVASSVAANRARAAAPEVVPGGTLRVFPSVIELHGDRATARFLVQRLESDRVGPQIADLDVSVLDSSIAVVEGGRVVALTDGETELEIRAPHGDSVRVPIRVSGASSPPRWQFVAHVESILSRRGCNSGACHGALAGKGGFRLSLRGYAPAADHYAITRQDRGRRLAPADPGRSLVLAKPAGLIPHKGGLRLPSDSRDFQILAEWIAGGAVGPQDSDAALERIEVLPEAVFMQAGTPQQLIVRAHYADGRVEDVTEWAKFSSADETVAVVDPQGQVEVRGSGRGAIAVWFASRIAMTRVTVPYEQRGDAAAYREFAPANFIDEILLEEWKSLRLAPSPRCSDATFVRRVCLDATGRLPSPEEVLAFLADRSDDKRAALVDRLLSSESYVDYWAYKWSDLLLINGTLLRPDAVKAFYAWVREQVDRNTSWEQFARQIVLARGNSLKQGATNFYAIHQTPEAMTENICQAFLGLSIGCAKCHNHPLEKWTNDQYYAMANLFARVRAKGWGGDTRNGDGNRTLVVLDRGDVIQPRTGKILPPAPLDASPVDPAAPGDRRRYLADWLTRPENPYFSRAIVNRVWANFMGTGLVEPVDDLRASNPPTSPRLLDALSDYLIREGYDLKALMRLIMNSEVYQRSSAPLPENAGDHRFYCRYYPRRLMAEVLHDAIVTVTEVPTKFDRIEFPGADRRPIDFYPEGTRAIELYDSAVVNYFLQTFGRHQRRITCECERSNEPTVVQALHLNNGDTLNDKLAASPVVTRWIESSLEPEEVIERAYVRCLSRPPTAAERTRMIDLLDTTLAAGTPRREAYEDLLWGLMTCPEFLFAH